MQCQHCNNIFKTSSVLKNHQKTAKYCLKLQGNLEESSLYICNHCGEKLSTKHRLKTHTTSCKTFIKTRTEQRDYQIKLIEEENIQLKEQIKLLEKENIQLKDKNTKLTVQKGIYMEMSEKTQNVIIDMAKRPTTTNTTSNNKTQNILLNMTPLDMSKEGFSQAIQSAFTKEHLLEGQKGVARFAVDKLLRDDQGKLMYVCTDPSRQIYRFKTLQGDLERDIKAKKLTTALSSELLKKSHNLAMDEIGAADADVFVVVSSNYQDIRDMSDDNGGFRTELASLTTI